MKTTNGVPLRIRIEYMENMPNGGIQAFPDANGKYMYYSDVAPLVEALRVDLSLMLMAVKAGDPYSELRIRFEDMLRRTTLSTLDADGRGV